MRCGHSPAHHSHVLLIIGIYAGSMSDPFEHPDPEFVPTVGWGAPVPLRWERVGDGFWHVWPPSCFKLADDGSEWRLGEGTTGSFYKPVGPSRDIRHGPPVEHAFGHQSPIVEWGKAFPANWYRFDDGRLTVHLGTLRVRCGRGLIGFDHFTRGANFFFPRHGIDIMLDSKHQGRAEYMGYAWGSRAVALHWRTPTSDGRWRLGQLRIDPPETHFAPMGELMPLILPTADEIEDERKSYLDQTSLERGELHYATLMVDLAGHEKFIRRVGKDTFAAQVQRFMSSDDLIRRCDKAHVYFGSERNYGVILSTLRRYGETYMMYDSNWANADPDSQREIERIFADAGYVRAIVD